MGENIHAYRVLVGVGVGGPEGKRPLFRSKHRWDDDIYTGLSRNNVEVVGWILVVWCRDWRLPVDNLINFQSPRSKEFLDLLMNI